MKILLKTVKNDKYTIDADPSITILELKKQVEGAYNIPESWQTLIFSGQVMINERTVGSYNVREDKDYIVLFSKKPTTAPKTIEPEPAPVTTDERTPSSTQSNAPSTQQPSSGSTGGGDSLVPTQQELNSMVDRIAELGYPRDQVVLALRASFFNAERAVEYLLNGFPQQQQVPQPRNPPRPTPSSPSGSGSGGSGSGVSSGGSSGGTGGTGGGSVLDQLRQHPQFPLLCRLAQEGGSEALARILTYMAQTNPEIIQYINDHKEEFIQLLNTPVSPNQQIPLGPMGGAMGGGGGGPTQIRIPLSEHDEQVINNLISMGFSRNRVIQAYILFERDEQMTAEYLANNPNDDD